jgi:hypothetical protein
MSNELPPEMLAGAELFGNGVLSTGRGFGFTRHMTDGETRSAVCVFMCDDHPLAAKLHQVIRAACSEAELEGKALGLNKDAALNTLLPR